MTSFLKMLNPWVILAVILAIGTAGAGGYLRGVHNTKNSIAADIAREEQLAQRVYDNAILAAASEISKIEIVNRTITQEIEREVRTREVYLTCRHDDDTKRMLDAILTGEGSSESISRSKLSSVDPAG